MNRLLVHNDNVCNKDDYEQSIKFLEIEDCLLRLSEMDFDILYIKDVLSGNVLDFMGLVLAYHIRLSAEIGDKRFVPIVILSNLDGFLISKISPYGQILFTKNCYLNKAPKQITNLDKNSYTTEFLEKIQIDMPKDISSNHDIANEWAIYQWAEALHVKSDAIQKNNDNIKYQLYFKYIQAKYQNIHEPKISPDIQMPTKKGKVLLIDDEWAKGWSDIIAKALKKDRLEFETFEYDYADKNWQIISQHMNEIKRFDPDVVILDLRLSQSDHSNNDIDSFYGIKILKQIKEYNPGIQVIMLTATSKSTILEKLYDYGVLGYVKKEHPQDLNISTIENINKFVDLIDKALIRKQLKEIFLLQKDILQCSIIPVDEEEESADETLVELKKNIPAVFELLNSNLSNRFVYATLALFRNIEIINEYYIYEEGKGKDCKAFWRKTNEQLSGCETNRKIQFVAKKLKVDSIDLDKTLSQLTCTRNYLIHPGNSSKFCTYRTIKKEKISYDNILKWYKAIKKIVEKME